MTFNVFLNGIQTFNVDVNTPSVSFSVNFDLNACNRLIWVALKSS